MAKKSIFSIRNMTSGKWKFFGDTNESFCSKTPQILTPFLDRLFGLFRKHLVSPLFARLSFCVLKMSVSDACFLGSREEFSLSRVAQLSSRTKFFSRVAKFSILGFSAMSIFDRGSIFDPPGDLILADFGPSRGVEIWLWWTFWGDPEGGQKSPFQGLFRGVINILKVNLDFQD